MPRIAAVLGVFSVIAICIFVNTKRYPAVWEMVGSSPWFTQNTNSSPKDSSPQPSEIAESDVSEQPSVDSQLEQEPLAPRTPPSLRPEISSHSNSVTDPGADYSIRISSATNAALSDLSDSEFNIDVPQITSLSAPGSGTVGLDWMGASFNVFVEHAPALSPETWTSIAGPINDTNWTGVASPGTTGFYRLRVE